MIFRMKINKVGWTYFAIVENFLSKEECYSIIDACQGTWNYTQIPAGAYPNGWVTGEQKRHIGTPWEVQFKSKIDHLTGEFNRNTYKFDLLPTYRHFVNRYEEEDLLDWHVDNNESIEDLFIEFAENSPKKLHGAFQQVGKYPIVWERVFSQLSEKAIKIILNRKR